MKKQSFIFSSAILIFSAVAAKLIGALFRIPLANLLGGTGMGYFSSAYSIFLTIYALSVTGLPTAVAKLTAEMKEAAKMLEFEHAAYLRDKIKELEGKTK